LLALPAVLLLAFGVGTDIRWPGIYMDGVIPDWLVVPILNSKAQILSGVTLLETC
jgi:hypothetical protein